MSEQPLIFYLNGKKTILEDFDPLQPLADYLTAHRHRGTKIACAEGGCGACTVMISHWDHAKQKVEHRAVVSCLLPLIYVDNMLVTTIEGLEQADGSLHPVQQRISEYHGTQCGM